MIRYTKEDVEDALALAKPGRHLPLDNEGNMSADGVRVVIHNLCALAEAYLALLPTPRQDEAARPTRCEHDVWLGDCCHKCPPAAPREKFKDGTPIPKTHTWYDEFPPHSIPGCPMCPPTPQEKP